MRIVFSLVMAFALCFLGFGQVNVKQLSEKVSVPEKAYYFHDAEGSFYTSNFSLPNFRDFKPYAKSKFSEGVKNGIHWFLLDIENNQLFAQELVMSFTNNELDLIKLFFIENNQLKLISTEGDFLKFRQRPTQSLEFVIPFKVPEKSTTQILVGIQKDNRFISSEIFLQDYQGWSNNNATKQLLLGFWFGGLIFYLLLSFLLALVLNKNMYWFYFGYVLFTLLFMLTKESILFKFIYYDFPQANDVLASRFAQLSLGLFAFFSSKFLVQNNPNMLIQKFFYWIGISMLGFVILSTIDSFIALDEVTYILIPLFFIFLIIYVLGHFAAGVYNIVRHKSIDALAFTIAFTLMLVTVLATSLGFFNASFQIVGVQSGLYLALLVEISILTFYLIYNFKKVQDQKLAIQQVLNQERTNNIKALIEEQEKERKKIGREIHDALGSKFSILLQQIRKNSNPQELETEVESISNSIREISYEMMPRLLLESGLELTLKGSIDKLNNTYSQDFLFFSEEVPKTINKFVENNLFRIFQESLNNALKYAQFTEFSVQLIMYDEYLLFQIEDDGVGFDLNKQPKGLGLPNIKTRCYAIGATLTINSAPNRGTLIMIKIPKNKLSDTAS